MATQDARISTALPGHPKTKKLAKRLGLAACWHLVCLFLWAAANRSDGSLSGMTDEDIELAVDWDGSDGDFVSALKAVGFLDGTEGDYAIHDWADHNPWAAGAETRSAKASWNAIKRHHGEAEADRRVPEWAAIRGAVSTAAGAAGDADSTHVAMLGSNAPSPSPSPSPFPSLSLKNSSLRSESSTAAPLTADPGDPIDGEKDAPKTQTDAEHKAEAATARAARLAQVTRDAIETFNASKLTKANGGLVSNVDPAVGADKRRQQVARCLNIARDICRKDFESEVIVRDFWEEYWEVCFEDDHKSGRAGGGKGHEGWLPGFEYLTRKDVMLAIYTKVGGGQ